MPGSDRDRRRAFWFLRATRGRYCGIVDARLRGRTYRCADVLGADDRQRSEPPAHRGAARRIHGLLRSPESGCHFRTRKKLNPPMSKIDVGKKAPQFTLDGTGGSWSLSDGIRSWVVLSLCPRAG